MPPLFIEHINTLIDIVKTALAPLAPTASLEKSRRHGTDALGRAIWHHGSRGDRERRLPDARYGTGLRQRIDGHFRQGFALPLAAPDGSDGCTSLCIARLLHRAALP